MSDVLPAINVDKGDEATHATSARIPHGLFVEIGILSDATGYSKNALFVAALRYYLDAVKADPDTRKAIEAHVEYHAAATSKMMR